MSVRGTSAGLGRGLSALLGDTPAEASREGSVRMIDIAAIRPNPSQPRRHFDETALSELADSIRERGVLQPILVRVGPGGQGFELIAGERRWRAAQRAGLHRLPAIVRDFEAAATAEVALIENIQRENLNALEDAQGYRQLILDHGHTQEQLAVIVHKSRSHVANMLRLLDLPPAVQDMLGSGIISMGHARALLTAADPEAIAREILAIGLSVRLVEERVRGSKPPRTSSRSKASPTTDPDLAALERQLSDLLGLKVRIAHAGAGGTVSLAYSSLDQLDMVCQRLSGEPI